MSDNKKTPGRPRQYEDTATKMSMFRARQAASGYLRREVLMTEETAVRVKALAEAHQVSATDVASALLEYGLAQYDVPAISESPFGALRSMGAGLQPKGALGYSTNACSQSAASFAAEPLFSAASVGIPVLP